MGTTKAQRTGTSGGTADRHQPLGVATARQDLDVCSQADEPITAARRPGLAASFTRAGSRRADQGRKPKPTADGTPSRPHTWPRSKSASRIRRTRSAGSGSRSKTPQAETARLVAEAERRGRHEALGVREQAGHRPNRRRRSRSSDHQAGELRPPPPLHRRDVDPA